MERARPPGDPRPGAAAWLIAPLALGAVALAFAVTRAAPAWLAGAALAAILSGVVAWMLASVLWPGRADRVCPECGKEGVVRLDAREAVGRRCSACGWSDAAESAWLMAEEEEEALEPLVLRGRRRRRGDAAVDRPGASD